jgi:hypothetical protein
MTCFVIEHKLIDELNDDDLIFVSDIQDTEPIIEYLNAKHCGYEAFFVSVEDGDYKEIWGIRHSIPRFDCYAYRLISVPSTFSEDAFECPHCSAFFEPGIYEYNPDSEVSIHCPECSTKLMVHYTEVTLNHARIQDPSEKPHRIHEVF